MPPLRDPPPLRTDAQLLEACRAGNAHAWRDLVHRYRRLAWGIPRAMGLQPADADEVFQTTFAELLRYLPRLERPERLEAWLVTTSRRASLRLLTGARRRRRLADDLRVTQALHQEPEDAAIEQLRVADRLRRTVEGMGHPCGALLIGLFGEPRRPYRALARDLGFAVGSLGSLRARCLERLRALLAGGANPDRPGLTREGLR